jgi:hypothetical protein
MLSRIIGHISPSLNRWMFTLPNCVPYNLQISFASIWELVPEKILADIAEKYGQSTPLERRRY